MMDVCDDSAQSAPAGFTFDATHIIGDETQQQQQQQEQEDLVSWHLATNLKCVCLSYNKQSNSPALVDYDRSQA